MMEKNVRILVWIFVLISMVKIILNLFIKSPSSFADAYFYTLSAKSFFSVGFSGLLSHYPPLYPFIISWAYLFSNSEISYFLIKLTNSIISSLIIFPAYFLAKEYLKNEKTAFYTAIIIGLLPSNFSYSAFIMSENLFNLLFLTTICTLYIGFKRGKMNFLILSSVLIALSYATRITAIALFPIVLFFALTEKKYKEGFLVIVLSLIILAPYLILKGSLLTGYSDTATRIVQENRFSLINILFWLIMYPAFIYLQGFIVFTNSAIKSFKNNSMNRLFWISILSFLALALYHASFATIEVFPGFTGRPVGRYLAGVLPLIIIMGINGIKKYRINYFWAIPFSALMFYPLFPPNNIDVTWLGVISVLIDEDFWIKWSLAFVIVLGIIFIINKFRENIALKRIIYSLFILNLLVFAVIFYNVQENYIGRDDVIAGKYLNEIAPDSIVVIDRESCAEKWTKTSETLCDSENGMSLTGFWVKNVKVGDYGEGDYFVSKRDLDLDKVKEFGDIKIYSLNSPV